jgi:hypothetical protein
VAPGRSGLGQEIGLALDAADLHAGQTEKQTFRVRLVIFAQRRRQVGEPFNCGAPEIVIGTEAPALRQGQPLLIPRQKFPRRAEIARRAPGAERFGRAKPTGLHEMLEAEAHRFLREITARKPAIAGNRGVVLACHHQQSCIGHRRNEVRRLAVMQATQPSVAQIRAGDAQRREKELQVTRRGRRDA